MSYKEARQDRMNLAIYAVVTSEKSQVQIPREDKPDLYYWAEITGHHIQTINT